jgi:hypothetical protein
MYCFLLTKNINKNYQLPRLIQFHNAIKDGTLYNDDEYTHFRVCILSCNSQCEKINEYRDHTKFIVGEEYDLYDIKVIKKFKFYMYDKCMMKMVESASLNGHIKVLEFLKNSGLPLQYDNEKKKYTGTPLDLASGRGLVDVLEWWLKSNLPLEYTHHALYYASYEGLVDVLEWWLKSNLPLKYNVNAIDFASENGHVNVLDWWKNSGLPLKYTEKALHYAIKAGQVSVIDWWFRSGLAINVKGSDEASLIYELYRKWVLHEDIPDSIYAIYLK